MEVLEYIGQNQFGVTKTHASAVKGWSELDCRRDDSKLWI